MANFKKVIFMILGWYFIPIAHGFGQSSANQITEYFISQDIRLNSKSDGIKGTPFLFDTPQLGKILLDNGKIHEEILFNILLEKEEVYIQVSKDDNALLQIKNWQWILTAEESPRLFKKEILMAVPRITEMIFETDREKIVALHQKVLYNADATRDGYNHAQFDTFRPITTFYRIQGLKFQEIKFNNAELKAISNEKYDDLKKFIKSEKLNANNPQDLKKIFEFLHQKPS